MRITESQLRRVIRDVINEQNKKDLDEGMKEVGIGAAIAALAIFGILGRKAPSDSMEAQRQAAVLVQDHPDVARKAAEHGVDVDSLVNQGMGVGVDMAGMGMMD